MKSQKQKLQRKNRFLAVRHGSTVEEQLPTGVHRDRRNSGTFEKLKKRKADCYTLFKGITKSKVLIRTSVLSKFSPNRVASLGPMAPYGGHNGNHTG